MTWAVYGLKRTDTNTTFYVGMSNNPDKRFYTHRSDRSNRTFYEIERAKTSGADVVIEVISTHETKASAYKREQEEINSRDNLINRTGKHIASRGAPFLPAQTTQKAISGRIRMSEDEMLAHQTAADDCGLNFSAWARMILKQASRKAAKK